MNKKQEQERAAVYIKMRATKQLRENFRLCCEANGKNITDVLEEFVKAYIVSNMHKVVEKKSN